MKTSSSPIALRVLVVALIAQEVVGLIPAPRISDATKYSLQNPSDKQQTTGVVQTTDSNPSGPDFSDSAKNSSNYIIYSGSNNSNNNNDADDDDDDDDDDAGRLRIVIGEPYKSLIQTTTRFAVAQTSVTNYVQIDTFMDLLNDTGYMLSSPNILNKALRVSAMVLAPLMALLLFVPPSYWKMIGNTWRQNGRLLELERYLPNGLNEMGIIQLLESKTDELLARFNLRSNTCRQQSVCEAGQLLRCAFPKGSKSIVSFISENFSRPRYRDHAYIGSFLRGFIDRNCASSDDDMSQTRSCLGSMIRSLSSCPAGTSSSGSQKQAPTATTTTAEAAKSDRYQFIQVGRA